MSDVARASNRPLLDLYRTMRRIRSFEERVGEMFVRQGTAGSMLHLSIGEEGVAGVCAAMEDGDSFTTHHRGHGVFLARGGEPGRMLAEIGGKEAGYCAGKGGSMHIADMGVGHLGANAIVGGGIPHAVGAALSYKTKGIDAVSVAFFGDGAMQQGLLYESMNMAALWSLPVLFVCINNQYGMGTRIDRAAANTDFAARAEAFGLAGRHVDGSDVEMVLETAAAAMTTARSGTPGLLTMTCYRFFGHARMDKSPYRDAAEEAEGRGHDPVAAARARLLDRSEAREADLDALDAEAAQEMDAALDWALAQTQPPGAAMFDHVYAPDEPPPQPLRDRLSDVLREYR
ncbi:MAG: thiamine pyrophosphate-dependent dehydrogenase E1 component subunit alpha [Alphaproteobacteria bacterium]|nr:thiamine pyrophosphate-dependent dehydrogenase E1 component subunit alpha [Alphaproteobacteria bacterium]